MAFFSLCHLANSVNESSDKLKSVGAFLPPSVVRRYQVFQAVVLLLWSSFMEQITLVVARADRLEKGRHIIMGGRDKGIASGSFQPCTTVGIKETFPESFILYWK